MTFKLDYTRMADSIFALNALRCASDSSALPIGRDELPAIVQLEKDTLVQLLAGLHPHVTEIDVDNASFAVDADTAFRLLLEAEIPKTVLAKLQHCSPDIASSIASLRRLINIPIPRITPRS